MPNRLGGSAFSRHQSKNCKGGGRGARPLQWCSGLECGRAACRARWHALVQASAGTRRHAQARAGTLPLTSDMTWFCHIHVGNRAPVGNGLATFRACDNGGSAKAMGCARRVSAPGRRRWRGGEREAAAHRGTARAFASRPAGRTGATHPALARARMRALGWSPSGQQQRWHRGPPARASPLQGPRAAPGPFRATLPWPGARAGRGEGEGSLAR